MMKNLLCGILLAFLLLSVAACTNNSGDAETDMGTATSAPQSATEAPTEESDESQIETEADT